MSVDPERAKQEWLRYQLKSRTLAGVLGGSGLFQYLTAAAPGLTELVTMGKVWDLAQLEPRAGGRGYDLAIVDAPATGHGLAMLRAPSTYASIARVGPVGRHAERIDSFLRDPAQTGVLTVALPEEMPVNETVEFERALRRELDMAVDAIVVNALHPARFSADEVRRLEDARRRERASRARRCAPPCPSTAAPAPSTRSCGGCGAPPARRWSRCRACSSPSWAASDLERLSAELERRL